MYCYIWYPKIIKIHEKEEHLSMKKKLYAVVDLETTGGRASRDRITEVAIVLYDGETIIDTFESLINPETYIPYGITQLTGISQDMVQDAPKFYEVAKQIVEMTEGAIFVAHNVRFDYSFLRAEFSRLGFTFTRKQLCTVRLSRKAFPGLASYSLAKLIQHFSIPVNARHRAMADAKATQEILSYILNRDEHQDQINEMVNLGIKESLLPKNIDLEKIHALPEDCGVYYFHDQKGSVVYVGKSINIKKRVAEHFSKKTEKASKLQKYVHDISYERTGSELIALLYESAEIKRLRPPINRAQRVRHFPYFIHAYLNEEGYICLEACKADSKTRKKLEIIAEYPSLNRAKNHLNAIMRKFELCSRFCYIHAGKGACFQYHLKQCHGACIGAEDMDLYNDRVGEAMEVLRTVFENDFLIIDQGREEAEKSVVLIKEGKYKGFGYFNENDQWTRPDELYDLITPYEGNPETTRIIQRFLNQNPSTKLLKIV